MTDLAALKAKNAQRWASMQISPGRVAVFDAQARKLIDPAAKARYVGVQERLRQDGRKPVPWWFVAIVSVREYGGPPRWDRQLGQGDPLSLVSTHEPAGRGPFLEHEGDFTPKAGDVKPGNDAWTRCCLDALIDCAPHAALWPDWSVGGVMTMFEMYNGLGYAGMGRSSPYVWSGTNQYVSGKYVRDHVYDPDAVDVQLGCAPLLSRMMALDPTIKIELPAAPANAPLPAPPHPEPAHSFWETLYDLLVRRT
jgi:lysozyme family protein